MSSAHACYLHDRALYPCGGKEAPAHTALSLPQITIDYVDRPRDSCRRSSAAAAPQRRRVAPMTRFRLLLPPLRPHPPSRASAAPPPSQPAAPPPSQPLTPPLRCCCLRLSSHSCASRLRLRLFRIPGPRCPSPRLHHLPTHALPRGRPNDFSCPLDDPLALPHQRAIAC